MLNRSIPPSFKPIQAIELPPVERYELSNGIKVISAGYSDQEIIKMELVFGSGYLYTELGGLSTLFSKLLLGGTAKKTSSQLIESFDQFGGFVEISQGLQHLTLTLHGLRRFLPEYLRSIIEILDECVFPEKELEIQKKISQQNLSLNQEKPTYLARMAFKKQVFGSSHPFGRDISANDIDLMNQEALVAFYNEYISGSSFKIFVSGKIEETDIQTLNQFFGHRTLKPHTVKEVPPPDFSPAKILLEKKENMQSTLRIGKPFPGRRHPDFFKLLVTNTTFGGYFGSRLMRNIREEKGFTYGISSSINPVGDGAYWVLGSDVVKQNTLETLSEISKELSLIKKTEVSINELETVKNYMCGSFAGSLTTPFEVMDRYKNLELFDLPADYYDLFVEHIHAVSPEDVMEMANKHWDEESFAEVIVGEKI